jgi:hypothetical protein
VHLVGTAEVVGWVRDLGVDPDQCKSLTVLADGDGLVEFEMYEVGPDGRRRVVGNNCVTYRDSRPLTAPIPAPLLDWWRAGG